MVVQGERPSMGQKKRKIQTSKGRGVRQERSSNQKNTVNTNYTHKQLKNVYTNTDNLIKCLYIYPQNTKRKTFRIFRKQLSRIDMG